MNIKKEVKTRRFKKTMQKFKKISSILLIVMMLVLSATPTYAGGKTAEWDPVEQVTCGTGDTTDELQAEEQFFKDGKDSEIGDTPEGQDVTHRVSVSGLDLRVSSGNGYYDFIKNGELVSNAVAPVVGNSIRFEYRWSIEKDDLREIGAGDYFYFVLPQEYFSFRDTEIHDLTDHTTRDKIGTYQITGGNIKVTLNDTAILKESLSNGYVFCDGKVVGSGQNVEIVSGGIKLPSFNIGGTNGSAGEYPNSNNKPIVKNGTQLNNTNTVNWDVLLNYDNLNKRYNGEAYSTLNNSFFIDELQGNQTFNSLKIQTVLYTATSEGEMSNNHFLYTDVMQSSWGVEQIKEIQPTTEASLDIYKETLKNYGQPAYGVFENTVVIYFGNIPKSNILLPDKYRENRYNEIKKILDKQLSEEKITQNGYENTLAHFQSGAEDEVIAFQVSIRVDVSGDPETVTNQATLIYGDGEETSSVKEVEFQKIGGGAEGTEAKSVKIVKRDDNGALLKNVAFKLTKLNERGTYEDYTASDSIGTLERKTDENGEVTFEKLEKGQYKIVEVAGLSGYGPPVFSPSDTFEIKDTDVQGYTVEVVNPIVISIPVVKVWNDNNNQDGIRPAEVKVQLYANGKAVGEEVTLNEANSWKYIYSGLEKYADGTEIQYSIKEVAIADGYEDKVEVDRDRTFILTNTHTPKKPNNPIEPSSPQGPDTEPTQNTSSPNTRDEATLLFFVSLVGSLLSVTIIVVLLRKRNLKR